MTVTPHLFIPGPTNIPDAVRMAMNLPMEDMRSPEFPKFTLPLFEDLKKAFKMKDGRVFIFPSSGTGAWESAIENTLATGDKVLMSRFGQFSLLWADMAERLRRERIFIMGDAAHVMPPTGGWGGNTGIQDAHNLAWKLAFVLDGRAGPELLETYEEERHPIGELTASLTALGFKRVEFRIFAVSSNGDMHPFVFATR